MSIEEKERIEWKKFYDMKEELWNLIAKGTTEIDDSSGKLERWLCFTNNEELLKKIEDSTKKLNKQYQKASKEKVGYRNAPVILRKVENIVINSYDSYSSRKIEKGTSSAMGRILVSKITMLESFWGKSYKRNLKKYK